MDKNVKHILIFGVLAIALSFVYYFVFFLPQWNNKQLLLSEQEFEYKKEKEATAKRDKEIEEVGDNVRKSQRISQDNLNRARAECVAIADSNLKSFQELVETCQTELCRDNVLANKKLQFFGEGFIDSCTKNKL